MYGLYASGKNGIVEKVEGFEIGFLNIMFSL